MNKKTIISLIIIITAAALIFITLFGKNFFLKEADKNIVKAGFIMTGAMNEKGWNNTHYSGIVKACADRDVELIIKENVKENTGECLKAVKELISGGAEIIFLSSYKYVYESEDLIKKNKNVIFYSESAADFKSNNLSTYFSRMYQGRYLSGIIAGMATKTNKIGYVAAMPNNEVNRGINAFALGVKSVNKNAEIIVAWTYSWNDETEEKRLTNALSKEKNADVVTYHQNISYVAEEAEKLGIYSIGYHENLKNMSENYLTGVVCNWEKFYKEIINDYLSDKQAGGKVLWYGIEKNAVELTEYSPAVTDKMITEVEKAKNRLLTGKDVFSDKIYDNQNNLRCNENEMISDETLLKNMDWYAEGVTFYDK